MGSQLISTPSVVIRRAVAAVPVALLAALVFAVGADGATKHRSAHHRRSARTHRAVRRHRPVRGHRTTRHHRLKKRHPRHTTRHHAAPGATAGASGAVTVPAAAGSSAAAPLSGTGLGAGLPATGASTAATGASVARFNREDYRHATASDSLAVEARRNQVVVLNAWNGDLVSTLHRENPHLTVLVYQFVMYVNPSDPSGLGLCATPEEARANDWFLRGADGQPLTRPSVPGSLGVDPGNPSFQRACAAHVVALAKRYGFDGVMLDGLDAKPDYHFSNGVVIPAYPTLGGYQNAVTSLLDTMRGTLGAAGVQLWGNIGGAVATPGLWERWSSLMDGSMEESWTDGSLGIAQQLPWFQQKLDQVAWSEAHHKYSLLHSWNTSEAGNTLGLATMLLVAGGYSSYSLSNGDYSTGSPSWYSVYETAQRLGAPLGAYTRLRDGVYARRFTGGLVLVNASPATTGPIDLGGTYSGSGLTGASSVTLAPTSGLILLAG